MEKKPVLTWQSDDRTWSSFPSHSAYLRHMVLEVYALNKDNTTRYKDPITGDETYWIANVRRYNSEELICHSDVRHASLEIAQLAAEEMARKYVASDWAALNPSSKQE